MEWTGSYTTGLAGDTSAAHKEATRLRINFYRALVGVPADITFNSTYNAHGPAGRSADERERCVEPHAAAQLDDSIRPQARTAHSTPISRWARPARTR